MNIVYINGRFISEEEAFVPITDRGFLFGDGLFTTMKVIDGQARCLAAHLERLIFQAGQIHLKLPAIGPALIQALIQRNAAEKGIWRLKIVATSANAPGLDLSYRSCGTFLMTMKSFEPPEGCVRLAVYPCPLCRPSASVKSLAYLDRFYVQEFAKGQNCDDALVLGENGKILETAFSNFFWRVRDQIFIPSSCLPLLQGVALEFVRRAAYELKMTVQEVSRLWVDLPSEAQCYTCNALTDVRPVILVGERSFKRDFHFEDILNAVYERIVCKG